MFFFFIDCCYFCFCMQKRKGGDLKAQIHHCSRLCRSNLTSWWDHFQWLWLEKFKKCCCSKKKKRQQYQIVIGRNDLMEGSSADKPGWLKVMGRQKQNKRSRAQPWITHRLLLILSVHSWNWGAHKLRNGRCPELWSHNFYCNYAMVTLKKKKNTSSRVPVFPAAADGVVLCGIFRDSSGQI